MPNQISIRARRIDAGFAKLRFAQLNFQVGGDEVGSLVGDPCSPGDWTCATLSAEYMEGFAEFRRGLRVGFDGG